MAGIKSFRISDETKERLELLSASIGGNKDRVFNTLMDTYSLEQERRQWLHLIKKKMWKHSSSMQIHLFVFI